MTATAHTLVFTPNVPGLAAGAGLVELAGPGLLLPLYGLALLLTALPLAQRAASASPDRREVAVRRQPGVIQPQFRRAVGTLRVPRPPRACRGGRPSRRRP